MNGEHGGSTCLELLEFAELFPASLVLKVSFGYDVNREVVH